MGNTMRLKWILLALGLFLVGGASKCDWPPSITIEDCLVRDTDSVFMFDLRKASSLKFDGYGVTVTFDGSWNNFDVREDDQELVLNAYPSCRHNPAEIGIRSE